MTDEPNERWRAVPSGRRSGTRSTGRASDGRVGGTGRSDAHRDEADRERDSGDAAGRPASDVPDEWSWEGFETGPTGDEGAARWGLSDWPANRRPAPDRDDD